MTKSWLERASLSILIALFVGGVSLAEGEKKKTEPKGDSKTTTPTAKKQPEPSPYTEATRKPSRAAGEGETVVITNEYLEQMMSGLSEEEKMRGVYQAERHIGDPLPGDTPADETTPPSEGAAAADATTETSTPADAPKSVEELNAQVVELERRLLALKNPLLPRRYSDKKDPEAKDWDEQSHQQKIATTEKELAAAKAALAEAQKGAGEPR
ncbi:MAG TPA: hypothetical protein VD788_14055 [Candidatus Polarisedimenticolaceae bacterium]|nr:hypothetical protein [Candidatus Polarisedimenticolaceae bacterium]